MWEILSWIIVVYLIVNIVIPALIVWLVIKYIFHLRQRQNDLFLDDLGYVVRDAVSDALTDRDNTKKYEKTTHNTYTPKNK